mgnify:CR=1 FL=1|jgi:L-ascorbate metabolism protein UlaG (beta-lactamase superfamily)
MTLTRRQLLQSGAAAAAGLGFGMFAPPARARQTALTGDRYPADGAEIIVHPVTHASLVLGTPAGIVYADPVGGADPYSGLPRPDLVLITHEHSDHYDADTLQALVGDETRIIANPAVLAMLPAALKDRASSLANGENTTFGPMRIDAIPAYNLTPDRLKFHPKGRDNGYVLSVAGQRIYIAGDTEDIPEMRALEGIDLAFVPMNLPYTMDVAQAASAVAGFQPKVVYPYHYGKSDLDEFERRLTAATNATRVVRGNWY